MEKLDIRAALSAFNKITTQGTREEGDFVLGGIVATPSFDGYTVTLSDKKVSLNIHFHNKFTLDYDSKILLDEFMLKLDRINRDF